MFTISCDSNLESYPAWSIHELAKNWVLTLMRKGNKIFVSPGKSVKIHAVKNQAVEKPIRFKPQH